MDSLDDVNFIISSTNKFCDGSFLFSDDTDEKALVTFRDTDGGE